MNVYYARCISLIDTMQEARDLGTLRQMGLTVVNPDLRDFQDDYRKHGMSFFTDMAAQADLIAFRALPPHGDIPAGVAAEIRAALNQGKKAIELPTGILSRAMPVEQTREYLRECGQR